MCRCLYHWIDFPSTERAASIIRNRVRASAVPLAKHVASSVARLRTLELQKSPGIEEAISWASAIDVLGFGQFDQVSAAATLGSVIKYREDADAVAVKGMAWLVES